MKITPCLYSVILSIFLCQAAESKENKESYRINKSIIALKNKTLTIKSGGQSYTTEIESEKSLHLETKDYNFDGYKDFSVLHVDEGGGIYKIYRVFIFNKKTKLFNEIPPSCGDAFINLTIDERKKIVLNTYFDDNTPKTCVIFRSNNVRQGSSLPARK